jgi:tripartite-type tricarboxylate transporter receptor subunit TctC
MPEEAQAFYIDLFEKVAATEEWRKYAAEQALLTDLLTGAELQEYFLAEREKHRELLAELGELAG